MNRLRAFGAFWYDFVVGDDWRVAVAVVLGLMVTALVAHAGFASWWLLPLALLLVLPVSLWRATRR